MAQIETKVQASTAAAAVSGLALWALGAYVFKGDVPDVVTSWTYALVPALLTLAAGYLAPHAHRPDLAVPRPRPAPRSRGGHNAGDARASELPPPPRNVVVTDEPAGTSHVYGPVMGEPRGGYRGGARAPDVGPPPDVPSGSVTPPEKTLRPPGSGA